GFEPGPEQGPRRWMFSTFADGAWSSYAVTESDSNYDMGSIYPLADSRIQIIGPTIDGPQAYNPGGEIATWQTHDGGKSWEMVSQLTQDSEMNHSYVRRPLHANPSFYGIWADGDGRKPS